MPLPQVVTRPFGWRNNDRILSGNKRPEWRVAAVRQAGAGHPSTTVPSGTGIEHLEPCLQMLPFRDGKDLGKTQVEILIVRSAQSAVLRVADLSEKYNLEPPPYTETTITRFTVVNQRQVVADSSRKQGLT